MVKVYSNPNCVQCKMTKMQLKQRNINFEEIDLSTNPEAKEMIKAKGFKQAPVVITENDAWSGFVPDKIKALA